MSRQQWEVEHANEGLSLLEFLHKHFDGLSKKQVKRWIDNNACEINGKTERFSRTRLKRGDRVVFFPPREERPEKTSILYQDTDLLVVSKPTGVVSDDPTWTKTFGQVFVVHRLDKGTTGCLVFAKNEASRNHLLEAFRNREVEKEYWAVVDGVPEEKEGLIDLPLMKRGEYDGQTLHGPGNRSEGAKEAITAWTCMAEGAGASLLHCFPKTGRTHQIRVHLVALGHPILGDFQYCRSFQSDLRPSWPLLHAARLAFRHPSTGKRCEWTATPSEAFVESCRQLGLM